MYLLRPQGDKLEINNTNNRKLMNTQKFNMFLNGQWLISNAINFLEQMKSNMSKSISYPRSSTKREVYRNICLNINLK